MKMKMLPPSIYACGHFCGRSPYPCADEFAKCCSCEWPRIQERSRFFAEDNSRFDEDQLLTWYCCSICAYRTRQLQK